MAKSKKVSSADNQQGSIIQKIKNILIEHERKVKLVLAESERATEDDKIRYEQWRRGVGKNFNPIPVASNRLLDMQHIEAWSFREIRKFFE